MLKDKLAFITGSTTGIGWATANLFAENGATVILNDVEDEDHIESKARLLKETYDIDCIGIRADVSNSADVKRAYQVIFKTYKRLDILVNNAGVLEDNMLGMISDAEIHRTLGINTAGVIHNIQTASRLMKVNKSGSIINLSSIIGTQGNIGQTVYAASKAAVIGITKSAAKELAGDNIRVNAIAPGFIDTDMTRSLPQDKYQQRLGSIGMQRIGKAHDVANVALFLASDLSCYVTGQVIGVDGGMII